MEVAWPEPGVPLAPHTLYVYVPAALGAFMLAVNGDVPGPPAMLTAGVDASLALIQ